MTMASRKHILARHIELQRDLQEKTRRNNRTISNLKDSIPNWKVTGFNYVIIEGGE